jgi:hypothetical protein
LNKALSACSIIEFCSFNRLGKQSNSYHRTGNPDNQKDQLFGEIRFAKKLVLTSNNTSPSKKQSSE